MSALLCPVIEIRAALFVEENDQLPRCQGRFHFAQINLALRAARGDQFGSTGEKFARAAFVIVDVRMLVADDAVKRLAKLCQGQGIGRCSVEEEKDITVDFEKFTDAIT